MVAQRIQANYDCLQEVMKQFMRHADMTVALTVQVEGLVDQLQGGAWRGVGAEAFYAEMRDLILPTLRRLEDALQFAGEGTGKIHTILREAEEEAARLFRGEPENRPQQPGQEGEINDPDIPSWLRALMKTLPRELWMPFYIGWATMFAGRFLGATSDERMFSTRKFFDVIRGFGLGFGSRNQQFGFGKSQVDFTEWELNRLNSTDDPQKPGSPWWRAVNGQLLRDMEIARLLFQIGITTSVDAVINAWLNYLKNPSSETWYQAHNLSILKGYLENEHLILQESFAERLLAAHVLARVLYAQVLVTTQSEHRVYKTSELIALITSFIPMVGSKLVVGNAVSELAEAVASALADPRGIMVDWITSLTGVYPNRYPLTLEDYINLAVIDTAQGVTIPLIPYAGVTPETAAIFKDTAQQLAAALGAMSDEKYILLLALPHAVPKSDEERLEGYEQAIQTFEEVLATRRDYLSPNVIAEIESQLELALQKRLELMGSRS
ncbi:MAG: WXG100 family type VII secretion target [Anaerolineae bacterium]|nr:WXG100 family type VII secretion target [Anaerolineae bacterium]